MMGNRKLAIMLIFMAFCTANANEIPNSTTTSSIIIANPNSSTVPAATTPRPFDCRNLGQECLHNGICAADGSHCDCSSTSKWFGQQCQLRRCIQRHNPCENGAECEKTDQSFKCHCPIGFAGVYCERQSPTICDGPENPCGLHGTCHTFANLQQYQCQCHPGWTGENCSLVDHCQGNGCLNGHCVNLANGHYCECRAGWGGEYCELDVDECRIQTVTEGICKNGGNCQNLIGSFYCECPAGFVGQFCECPNGRDQCQESTCLNGGQCNVEISAITANWALDVKHFDWLWECKCPFGFEGPRCEQIIDDCALGRMTCVNGGKCVRPWLEEQFDGGNGNGSAQIKRIWHQAVCKCPEGYTGEFCEQDVNECEMYGDWNTGPCQNGATCMNRHGSYICLCVGGFDGKYCEHNIDDCGDNICYAGSTCLDGIARYNCLCAPDRVGTYCEFPNSCFNSPCANNGQCFADQETGNYMCQCQNGWRGRHCEEDIDECAQHSTSRCFNGKCLNTRGGFRCECEVGYTDEYCMTLVKYCEPNPCQNGATCLNDLGRYDCICLPGYSGKHCEVRAYQELNKCFLECQNGGICRDSNAQQCECPPPYAGILCEIEKPDPCEQNKCAHGSVCGPSNDYISYTCQCPAYLGGQFCEHQLVPCEEGGYNPCVHGQCQKGFNKDDYTCSCIGGWTGQLCDRSMDEGEEEEETNGQRDKSSNGKMPICPLATNPCLNGGQCLGVWHPRNGVHDSSSASSLSSSFFECICPRGFSGTLCEGKMEERCGRGCRNGGKCIQKDSQWICQCPAGFEGSECENEKNACLNMICKHKGKCINLGGTDFRCDCAPGWTGYKCEYNVDDCENIICLNGGSCTDRVNNYRCNCARGYAGTHCEIQIPVDKYNETDLLDMDNCRRKGCQAKAANGKCDPECNHYACKFDGGDCSTKQADPFDRCPQPSYCSHVFADNKCDKICNNEQCLFDGFDCLPRSLAKCPRLAECALRYANGQCDEQCNIAACGWDGGDCDHEAEPDPSEKPQILPGELMLVLAVQPEKLFPNLLREFLLSLNAHLRASLALSIDKDGQARLFEWTTDKGIGERVKIPENLNVTTMFIVHYEEEEGEVANGEEDGKAKRKKRATKEEEQKGKEGKEVKGVAVFMRVDVTMCNLLEQKPNNNQNQLFAINFTSSSSAAAHQQHHRRPLLGVHSPCFSDLSNVAAYVGAASAKKALPDIGVTILQSEVRRTIDIDPPPPSDWYALAFGLLCFVIASGGMVVVMKRQRPNRTAKRCAKTWFPPLLNSSSSKYFGSTSTLANHSQQPQQNHQQFCSIGGAPFCWQHYPQLEQFYNHQRNQQQHHQQSSASSIAPLLGHHQHHYGGPQQAFVYQHQQQQQQQLRPDGLINSQTKLEPWMVNGTHGSERHRTLLHLLFHNLHLMTGDEQNLLENIDLLFKAAIDVDAQDRNESTALSLAVRNRKYLTVKKLVEYGADVNLEDADYKTPLYHACAILPSSKDPDEQIKIVEFLLAQKEIRLDTLTKSGESPLMRCALIRHEKTLKIAEMLLERVEQPGQMDFVNQTGEPTMRTALHMAASVNNDEMIKFLVKNGANKEAMDKEGKTPLFVATEQGQYKSVEALLKLGADRNKTDINETKILELASQPGYEMILNLFMQHPDHPQHNHHYSHSHHRQNFQQQRQQQQQNSSSKVFPTSESGTGKRQKGALKRAAPSVPTSANCTAVHSDVDEKLESSSSSAKKAALVVLPKGWSSSPQQHSYHHSLLTPPKSDESNHSNSVSPNINNSANAAQNAANPQPNQNYQQFYTAYYPRLMHQQVQLEQFYNHQQRNQQQQHHQQSSALPLGHHQHHYYGPQQPFVDQHHISQLDEISENELVPKFITNTNEFSDYLSTGAGLAPPFC